MSMPSIGGCRALAVGSDGADVLLTEAAGS